MICVWSLARALPNPPLSSDAGLRAKTKQKAQEGGEKKEEKREREKKKKFSSKSSTRLKLEQTVETAD